MISWRSHPGLVNALGSCDDDSLAAVDKALAYLGISISHEGAIERESARLVLPVANNADDVVNQAIFSEQDKTWCIVPKIQPPPVTYPGGTSEPSKHDRNTRHELNTPEVSRAGFDWTDLLPNTDHVNLLKSRDWASTALGPMQSWPMPLRLMVIKTLDDPRPANLYWGPTYVAIYNEPFTTLAAQNHPFMLGTPLQEALPTAWPVMGPMLDSIRASGKGLSVPSLELLVEKTTGLFEEGWYDTVFFPIRGLNGEYLGLCNTGSDVTDARLLDRRSRLLFELGGGSTSITKSTWQHIIDVCESFDRDVPLLAVYSVEQTESASQLTCKANLRGTIGIEPGHSGFPKHIDVYDGCEGFISSLRTAKSTTSVTLLETEDGALPDFLKHGIEWRGHGVPATHIATIPLFISGLIAGFLIMALNPRTPYNDAHVRFLNDIGRVASGLLAARTSAERIKIRENQLASEFSSKQRLLHRVAEVAPVGICAFSPEGMIIWANSTYFQITDIPALPELRRNHQGIDFVLEEDQAMATEAFTQCVLQKVPYTQEIRMKRQWTPQGSQTPENTWIFISVTPILEDDVLTDVLSCVMDISQLKWAEQLQKKSAEMAKEAKVQQERFIDITSHEMRNPLSAILQCADNIYTTACEDNKSDNKSLSPKSTGLILDDAQTILFCAAHQKRIIDDILTISKLGSSLLSITPISVDVALVVKQALQAFGAEMTAHQIKSSFHIQQNYKDLNIKRINCDPSRVTQILINLITNAIKFTKEEDKREITIRLDAFLQQPQLNGGTSSIKWFPSGNGIIQPTTQSLEADEHQVYFMFEVEDSGTGISDHEMTSLFNRFSQGNPKTHVKYGGSGLGLFISRQLAELQGGMIGLASTPGEGSIFAFYVRTTICHAEPSIQDCTDPLQVHSEFNPSISSRDSQQEISLPSTTGQDVAQKRFYSPTLLLVEDNIVNQKIMRKQLERKGYTVRVANHGQEALDIVRTSRHWATNDRASFAIDAILMDWEMPVMDGLTCTRTIRKMEDHGSITKHLPIIGTTANARLEQVQMAMAAGMDDLLTKPFTISVLVKRLRDIAVLAP